MNNEEHGKNFWLGNAIMALALILLLNMGALWEKFGLGAMIAWVILAGIGTFFLMSGKSKPPSAD